MLHYAVFWGVLPKDILTFRHIISHSSGFFLPFQPQFVVKMSSKEKNNEKLTNNSKYTRIRYNKVLWHSVLLSNNYAQLCSFFLILLSSLCQHTYRHNLFFCPPLCLSDFKHQSVLFDIRLLLALMCMCHLQSSNIYTDVRNSNYVTHVCVLG